ncbi:hypothetical protein F2P81_015105 [Scophthalmus maximus]|uniref:Uncharacterized protein n=1 Tax=Scophthalmus maximus TaxID=52904 RepID=A0A6A4SJW2_SCOMX|nr:hypothetical protein F2P81_015105 [Scophthalmus maximus]
MFAARRVLNVRRGTGGKPRGGQRSRTWSGLCGGPRGGPGSQNDVYRQSDHESETRLGYYPAPVLSFSGQRRATVLSVLHVLATDTFGNRNIIESP